MSTLNTIPTPPDNWFHLFTKGGTRVNLGYINNVQRCGCIAFSSSQYPNRVSVLIYYAICNFHQIILDVLNKIYQSKPLIFSIIALDNYKTMINTMRSFSSSASNGAVGAPIANLWTDTPQSWELQYLVAIASLNIETNTDLTVRCLDLDVPELYAVCRKFNNV